MGSTPGHSWLGEGQHLTQASQSECFPGTMDPGLRASRLSGLGATGDGEKDWGAALSAIFTCSLDNILLHTYYVLGSGD